LQPGAFAKNCKREKYEKKKTSIYVMCMALGSLVLHDFSYLVFSEIVTEQRKYC